MIMIIHIYNTQQQVTVIMTMMITIVLNQCTMVKNWDHLLIRGFSMPYSVEAQLDCQPTSYGLISHHIVLFLQKVASQHWFQGNSEASQYWTAQVTRISVILRLQMCHWRACWQMPQKLCFSSPAFDLGIFLESSAKRCFTVCRFADLTCCCTIF